MDNVAFSKDTAIDGEVIATGITYEEFLTTFDGQHVEWVDGVVIQMSPVTEKHNALTTFLIALFMAYLGRTGGGRVFHDPMTMKTSPQLPARLPDIQIILPENLSIVKDTHIAGAADLVVEIISPDSDRPDRVDKFREYERGGVKEYWILDAQHREALFYCPDEQGLYKRREPDENGVYQSCVLRRFRLLVEILWREPLPDFWEIAQIVEDMLKA